MPERVERIRGRRGQRLRAQHLRANPLCAHCLAKGRTTLATEVDHIVPLHQGGDESPENRQSLCDECHEIKTITERGATPKPTIGLDGWPIPRG
jgi:5-methylcytosine-specific restriction protein A